MMKSLFAGATAVVLIAGAAVAQQAYDSTTSRTTTTVTAPAPVAPPAETTTTVQRTVDPAYFDPTRTSSYHEEHVKTVDGQTVEKNEKTQVASPYGTRTTTYSQTTTSNSGN
jgi:hypothetical protein